MAASLPHLRFVLMVGIGAGIPSSSHDIRLGDVAVSRPTGASPGVVQYDLGKLKENGNFERVGSLDAPPDVLLKALASLNADHLLEEPRIPEILDEMMTRYPRMSAPQPDGTPSFTYQGMQYDRLFESSSIHRTEANTSSQTTYKDKSCVDCDPAGEVKRNDRESAPRIHYGVIASGDSLVKDATSRDQILHRLNEDCICLEMEAAGLQGNFPCLVIRGICDYADTHKNDRWQNYAAAVAAAFARELLETMDGEDVERASTVEEHLRDVKSSLEEIETTTNHTHAVVRSLVEESHVQRIWDWLKPSDPSSNLENAYQQRHPDTGQWFLESSEFKRWKNERNTSLWLHGIPGCGKTILSSTIVKTLKCDPSIQRVLYFYFDFNDTSKQTIGKAITKLTG